MKKLISILLFAFVASASFGQSYLVDMKNALGGGVINSDTVVNTGVATVQTVPKIAGDGAVTVVMTLVKISGTVAGSVILQGSVDNTNWLSVNTEGTQTAITAVTATDVATQRFSIHLKSNPFLYYRLQWTGAGTMSATIAAKFMKRSP